MANSGNLTAMVIAIGVFILVIALSTNVYIDIMANNGGTVDSSYLAKYAEIQGYQTQLNNFSTSLNSQSLWSTIPSGIASSFNALVIGISGVLKFFTFIDVVPQIFSGVFNEPGLGIPSMVFSFVIFAAGMWIATQAYKAIRNAPEAP